MAQEQLLKAYIPRGKNSKYNDEFTDKAVVIGNGHRTTNDRTSEKTVPKLIFSQFDRMHEYSPFYWAQSEINKREFLKTSGLDL